MCALMPAYMPSHPNNIQHCCDFWPFCSSLTYASVALCINTIILALFSIHLPLSLYTSIYLFPYLSALPFFSFLTSKFSSVSPHSTACNHSNKVISSFFSLSVAQHTPKKQQFLWHFEAKWLRHKYCICDLC